MTLSHHAETHDSNPVDLDREAGIHHFKISTLHFDADD